MSKDLDYLLLDSYLLRKSRKFTIAKWYFTCGARRERWTKDETNALVRYLRSQVKEKNIEELHFNVSDYRRRHCPGRCDIEVHDRALCIITLLYFDMTYIHEILDEPSPLFWMRSPIRTAVMEHNESTLTMIEEEGGLDCGESLMYQHRIHRRSLGLTHLVVDVLQEYWCQYENEHPLACSVIDDFTLALSGICNIFDAADVSRVPLETDPTWM